MFHLIILTCRNQSKQTGLHVGHKPWHYISVQGQIAVTAYFASNRLLCKRISSGINTADGITGSGTHDNTVPGDGTIIPTIMHARLFSRHFP